ncbi:MAG: hypothetical protein ACE5D6_04555 [Candidatus Zixiibacteriota bacterium]
MPTHSKVVNLIENSQILNDSTKLATNIVCKFIILSHSKESVIILGPVSKFPYHADIVEHFCTMNNISAGWLKKPDIYEIYDKSYSINGGGWIEINIIKEIIVIYGLSTSYGKFDQTKVSAALSTYPEYSNYSIVFKNK